MKKLLYLLFVTLSLSVKSQITLESTRNVGFGQEGLSVFNTSNLGEKYFTGGSNSSNTTLDTITIYNSDWSLYRQVILPNGYGYYGGISDKLFNSDSLIEFLISTPGLNRTISVINELGQIVFTFPDSTISPDGPNGIINIGNDFKFRYLTNSFQYRVFSLPGTLPCNQCNFTSGITEPNQGSGLSGLNVYPNPFNNSLEINYNFLSKQDNPRIIITDILGRELRTLPLVNQSDKITINTTDLPRGTMIISLYGNTQNPVSKKVIKID